MRAGPRPRTVLLAALGAAASGLVVASIVQPPGLWLVSFAFNLVFLAPAVVGVARWRGWPVALAVVAGLGVYALVLESTALVTGFPYGVFRYGDLLGPPLIGPAPVSVLVAWTPLVLGSLPLLPWRAAWPVRALALTGLLVAIDLVLDPGAVSLGFWRYAAGGAYYGVPAQNFVGWIFSGGIAAVALMALWRRAPAPPALPGLTLAIVLAFWSAVAIRQALWIPAVLGLVLLAVTVRRLLADRVPAPQPIRTARSGTR